MSHGGRRQRLTPERRTALRAEIVELRAGGLSIREIARRVGVGTSTAQKLANPEATGECQVCGDPVGPGALRCRGRCAASVRQIWTREAIVETLRSYYERYGEWPSAAHLNPSLARRRADNYAAKGNTEKAQRWEAIIARYEVDGLPSFSSVQKAWGSWSKGLEAAKAGVAA